MGLLFAFLYAVICPSDLPRTSVKCNIGWANSGSTDSGSTVCGAPSRSSSPAVLVSFLFCLSPPSSFFSPSLFPFIFLHRLLIHQFCLQHTFSILTFQRLPAHPDSQSAPVPGTCYLSVISCGYKSEDPLSRPIPLFSCRSVFSPNYFFRISLILDVFSPLIFAFAYPTTSTTAAATF